MERMLAKGGLAMPVSRRFAYLLMLLVSGPTLSAAQAKSPTFAPKIDCDTGGCAHSVAIGDLDADGDADLATANFGSDDATILLNHGDGTFAPGVHYDAGDWPHSITIGDLDGDGDADLATVNVFSHSASILLNNGDGTFAVGAINRTGESPKSVAIGDLDGDGDADLAVANCHSDNVSVLLNQRVSKCEGDANGDGTVGPLDSGFVLARFGCPVGIGDPYCDAADQNGDGIVDPLDSGLILARLGDCP